MNVIVTGLIELISTLAPMILEASNASKEKHAEIMARCESAWQEYVIKLGEYKTQLTANDAQADAAAAAAAKDVIAQAAEANKQP